MIDTRLVKKCLMWLRAIAIRETGATLAEYALVTVFIGFAALVICNLLPAAIRSYVDVIYFGVSLPLP